MLRVVSKQLDGVGALARTHWVSVDVMRVLRYQFKHPRLVRAIDRNRPRAGILPRQIEEGLARRGSSSRFMSFSSTLSGEFSTGAGAREGGRRASLPIPWIFITKSNIEVWC